MFWWAETVNVPDLQYEQSHIVKCVGRYAWQSTLTSRLALTGPPLNGMHTIQAFPVTTLHIKHLTPSSTDESMSKHERKKNLLYVT